jgi:flagellar basal-body rod protein FlgG
MDEMENKMDPSILRLGNAMLNYESKISVISNNIANANTPGYKTDNMIAMSFDESLSNEIENSINKNSDVTKYTQLTTHTNYEQGELVNTEDEADLALKGDGFFCVDVNGEECYTRSLKITSDLDGFLVDQHGNRVQGENGDINVGNHQITIASNGLVIANDTYDVLGKIKTATFETAETVSKTWGGYYQNDGGTIIASEAEVLQGYQEQSNLDITEEYLQMMSISRSYETTQTVIQMIDEINGKSAKEIGQL